MGFIKDWFWWALDNYGIACSVIASIITGFTFIRKIGKEAKKSHNEFRALFDLPQHIQEIKAQLTVNGGASLKDSIVRIENNQLKDGAKLKAILGEKTFACFETNLFGECIYVNSAYLSMLKCNENDCIGNNWKNFIHPDDKQEVIIELLNAIEDKRQFSWKFRYLTSNDEAIPVFCKASPIYDYKNSMVGLFAIVRHIQEIPPEWQN